MSVTVIDAGQSRAILLNADPAVPLNGDLIRHTIGPIAGRVMMPAAKRQLFAPAPVDPRWKARFPIDMVVRPSQMRATAEDFAVAIPAAAALSKRYGGTGSYWSTPNRTVHFALTEHSPELTLSSRF